MAEATLPMLVNGAAETRVPATDRGFQYGDGLFETIALNDGRLEFWGRHMARLGRGCARLGLPAPDAALLRREAERLCAQRAEGVLKIMVTRGTGGRGYRLPDEVRPTRVLSLHPRPGYPADVADRGVRLRVCETRLAIQPRLAGLKHMNRLEQILARAEWREPEIAEGLMLDADGAVVEGTMTNLFVASGAGLRTPDLSYCGVEGIMRAVVLDLADELEIPCSKERLALGDVLAADEVFLTNSVIGIWPVTRLGDKTFAVGGISRRLAAALAETPKD